MHKAHGFFVLKGLPPAAALISLALGGCYNHFRYQPKPSLGDTGAAVRCAAGCSARRGELGSDAYVRCLQLCPLERESGRCSREGAESGLCVQHSELSAGKTAGLVVGVLGAVAAIVVLSTLRFCPGCP